MASIKVANNASNSSPQRFQHAHSADEIQSLKVRPNKQRFSFRKCYRRRFSIEQSTDDINKATATDGRHFYGSYAHIRKALDYSYHSHYIKERQWLQDSIIDTFMEHVVNGNDDMTTPQNPWFIYTVGAPGAGKRHTIMSLVREGKLPLLSFVHVDPQEIRRRLPEFASYVLKSPDGVDRLTRKEAGHIMEILVRVALEKGKNVILDGSLHDADWYAGFYQELRDKYPKMLLALLHVTAPRDLILHRATDVEMWTHRSVPTERIDKILEQIPHSIERLRPEVNYCCELLNSHGGIQIIGDTWENFSQTFRQSRIDQGVDNDKMIPEKMQEDLQALFRRMKLNLWKKSLFAVGMSSEENYKATPDQQGFFGQFADIRSTLDYTYHEHYEKKRQLLQDKIINDVLNAAIITDKDGNLCTTPTEPWLVFTAGAMGAGKSYTMNQLVEKGRFPLLAFVLVDPDEIRRHLPEFHVYVEQNPELAGELTRKESGLIAEILIVAGLRSGKNVLVDGSLRDAEWYKLYLARLRSEFPNCKQAIIHVQAPREAVFQRAAARAMTTGRIVPKEVLEEALNQVPRSVKLLAPLVDYFCEINNAPGALDLELLTDGETWDTFESKWVQTCAWIPNRRQFLRQSQEMNKLLTLSDRKEK